MSEYGDGLRDFDEENFESNFESILTKFRTKLEDVISKEDDEIHAEVLQQAADDIDNNKINIRNYKDMLKPVGAEFDKHLEDSERMGGVFLVAKGEEDDSEEMA
jgi:hypothetical protein